MKTLMASLVLLFSVNANASSGQQFVEDVLHLAEANDLIQVNVRLDRIVCGIDTQSGVGSAVLQTATGELLLVVASSFFSSQAADGEADSAVLTEIEGCGKRTARF